MLRPTNQRTELHAEIDRQIAEFVAGGGEIQKIDHNWNSRFDEQKRGLNGWHRSRYQRFQLRPNR